MTKIGFIDSGIGGLTVLEAFLLKNVVKSEHSKLTLKRIVYFADLKNLPYGDKNKTELIQILRENLNIMQKQKISQVILACNTSSTLLSEEIKKEFADLEIIDLISSVREAIKTKYNSWKNFIIFSTMATHNTSAYIECLKQNIKNGKFLSIPCPELVPMIEDSLSRNELRDEHFNIIVSNIVSEYVKKSNLNFEPEIIILGCTHYPLIKNIFQELFPNSQILDPAHCLTERLEKYKLDKNFIIQPISSDISQENLYQKIRYIDTFLPLSSHNIFNIK